jgi:hypothetical protein
MIEMKHAGWLEVEVMLELGCTYQGTSYSQLFIVTAVIPVSNLNAAL